MSISDRLDQIERETVEANEQWDCGRSAFNADNHAPPIDAALVNGERTLAAVRAVLDLHKAYPDEGMGWREDHTYGYVGTVCGSCGTPDEYGVQWPCPTVRAIATALGEDTP